jgi:hypothetical protein
MDVLALLAVVLLSVAFFRDVELLSVVPMSLMVLSFLLSLLTPGSAALPFAASLVIFALSMIRFPDEGSMPEREVHLEVIEDLARKRDMELDAMSALEKRMAREPEKSVKDYLASQKVQHHERIDRINQKIGTYCDEIRKNWG